MLQRLRARIGGFVRGDLAVKGLSGLRAVGSGAYALAADAEELRAQDSWDGWTQPTSTQLFLLSAWNALALQTLVDRMLGTKERVDAGTFAFAYACLRAIPFWIDAARSAKVDPAFRPRASLPADLPAWPRIDAADKETVNVLRVTYEALAPLPEYEVARLARTASPVHRSSVIAMQLDVSDMHTAAEVASTLDAHAHSPTQYREVCSQLVAALDQVFTLGQVVALPTLLERVEFENYRRARSVTPPLAAITRGWAVEDVSGARAGFVERVEASLSSASSTPSSSIPAPSRTVAARRSRRLSRSASASSG